MVDRALQEWDVGRSICSLSRMSGTWYAPPLMTWGKIFVW
jgi:hypothetical protein